MATSKNTSAKVVKLADFRSIVVKCPAVRAAAAMEAATTDAEYDAAKDRLEMAAPTSLEGIEEKFSLVMGLVDDLLEGDAISKDGIEALRCNMDMIAKGLATFTAHNRT